MKINVREANSDDINKIAQIHVASWQKAYQGLMPQQFINSFTLVRRTTLWKNILTKGLAKVLVAEFDANVVGFLCYGQSKDNKDKNSYELSSIYLSPKQFGRGIGTILYQECELRLQEIGGTTITLWSLDSNKPAISFYQKLGFTVTGNVGKERLNEVVLNDIEFSKRLSI